MRKVTDFNLLILACAAGLAGCSTTHTPPPTSTPGWTGTKGALAGHSIVASVDHVYKDNDIVPGAAAIHFIDAATNREIYGVYVRPDEKTAVGTDAWAMLYSHPSLYLSSGWGYATGSCPVFVTRHITASGSGTRMLIEYLVNAQVVVTGYRAYLLDELLFADTVTITKTSDSSEIRRLYEPNTYTEITILPNGGLDPSPQAPIPANLMAIVNAWVLEANLAGVTP